MHRKLSALAISAFALALPAQAVADPRPTVTTSEAGGIEMIDLPDTPSTPTVQTVPGEKAVLDARGMAVAPASAPQEVKDIIAAGNRIARKPYRYGGGHGRWVDTGYDCSGSVSYALHAAGLLESSLPSGPMMRWGERGRGQWVTIRANAGHAYMVVAGLRFDTSARKITGNRWTDEMRSARGYAGRHPAGL